MALGDSAYDAFNQQMSQYFGALNGTNSGPVNVPGYGNLQRLYNPDAAIGMSNQLGVNGGGEGGGDPLGYGAASATWQARPDAQKYSYETYIDPAAVKGDVHQYSYDPDSGGVNNNAYSYDNTPSLWGDKIFPGVVMAALSAAGGMAGAGVLGAAGGGAGVAGGAGGAGELGSLSAADALGEFGGQAALGGTQAGTDLASLGSLGTYAGDGASLAYPTAQTSGGLLNVGAVAENAATQPGAWDTALNAAKDGWTGASDAWGNINPLLRTGIGTLGSQALQGLSGGGNDVGGLAALDSAAVAADGAAPGLTSSYGSVPWYQSLLNSSSSKTGSTNPFNALVHAYNSLSGNGSTGFDTNDAWSLAGLGSSIYNGVAGSSAAKTAAGQQTDAINNASALTSKLYGDSVARNQPFLNAGTSALGQQTNLLGLNGADAQKSAFGQFQASPDYQWRFDQGMKAAGNNAAASGLLGSGRYMKDLTNYGQGQASQEYGNYQSRLSNLVNVGQNSANLTGQLSQGYGQLASNLLGAGGIAQSAGTMGSSNAVTNAISQFLKLNQNGYYAT